MSKNKKRNAKRKEAVNPPKAPAPRSKESTRASNIKLIAFMLLAFLLIGLGYYFVGRRTADPPVTAGEYRDYNVVLITVDTLRADHLPAYGYTKVKTPSLDQLARTSYVFEDVISTVPLTLPSHTSIMTGLLPIGHGVRDNGGFFVDAGETTLAEVFKANGYRTGAFVSAFVLDSRWKLNQGFDFYYDNFELSGHIDANPRDIQRLGGETEKEAERWLEENKGNKFFLWVHYYDPHDPYSPPEPYKSEYRGEPYDGEIAYTDENIGKLVTKLNQLQVMARTVIVITSDHGEGLGEHGEPNHGMFLYNSTQHVPLFIHTPDSKSQRVKGVSSLIDLSPTILDLTGLATPREVQGKSLIPMMNGTEKTRRIAYSESLYSELHYGWSPLQSITRDTYKFIDAPGQELYDLAEDPAESRNLLGENPSVAKTLFKELQGVVAAESRKENNGPQKMDPETEEKLRALGYVGGSVAPHSPERRKIDPKDKIELVTAIQRAYSAMMAQDYPLAVTVIAPVLQEDPDMMDGQFIAGISYAKLGDYKKAIDHLLKTIALKPDHTLAIVNLAFAYQLIGDMKSAEFWYKRGLEYDADQMFATMKLAELYRATNQNSLAESHFRKAVEFYEKELQISKSPQGKAGMFSTLGEIYFAAGDLVTAAESLKNAIQLSPKQALLNYNLAQVYEAGGKFVEAAACYEKEIRIDPSNFRAFNNLGILYLQSNRMKEAVLCFQKVIQLNPNDSRGYLMLASAYKKMGKDSEANSLIREAQIRQQNMIR